MKVAEIFHKIDTLQAEIEAHGKLPDAEKEAKTQNNSLKAIGMYIASVK